MLLKKNGGSKNNKSIGVYFYVKFFKIFLIKVKSGFGRGGGGDFLTVLTHYVTCDMMIAGYTNQTLYNNMKYLFIKPVNNVFSFSSQISTVNFQVCCTLH